MATEALTLPVFETAHGKFVDEPKELPELRHGFLLSETGNHEDGTVDIHGAHAARAVSLLTKARLGDEWDIIAEFQETTLPDYTSRHVDGLSYAYFQVHTMHGEGDTRSSFTLEGYDMDVSEHEIAVRKRGCYLGLDGSQVVGCDLLERPFLDTPSLWSGTEPRHIDALIQVETSSGQTLVFPNGYNAKTHSTPSRLWFHGVRTVSDTGEAWGREVSLSRLELVR